MPSELFDPLLELAFSVAQKGNKAKPRIAPPQRLVPMLRFTRMPARARQTIHDVLDTDADFRARVLAAADERTVGRAGMAFLERNDGWQELVARFVEASDEPILTPSGDTKKLEHRLQVAERSVERLEVERDDAVAEADELRARLAESERAAAEAKNELTSVRVEIGRLTDERQRAVTELKQTELLLAKHVAERKLVEQQLEDMTAAQMNTVADGGGVTDREVRERADRLRGMITALTNEVAELREQATPTRTRVERRTPMPLPPGVHDDSEEAIEYLLRVPGMLVLVDGYNVTRRAHDDWSLEEQRDWLAQGLRAVAARTAASFEVVFDGADVGAIAGGGRDRGVTVRFSPDGVEADDVVIDDVSRIDATRPVLVVSNDRRVQTGARNNGANIASTDQLLAILS